MIKDNCYYKHRIYGKHRIRLVKEYGNHRIRPDKEYGNQRIRLSNRFRRQLPQVSL